MTEMKTTKNKKISEAKILENKTERFVTGLLKTVDANFQYQE